MSITAVIIEDEYPARITLRSFLRKYFSQIEVVAELDNIKDAVSFLKNNPADIIFLDVQLKDGKGMDILNLIDSSQFRIIFTTAHDEYALDAFKHKSFGYLLKPIDPDDFKEILNRVVKDISGTSSNSKKVKITVSNGYKWIDLNDIIRCESQSNYTNIICKNDQKTYTLSRTLKYVENELINSEQFIRVHQSHLVNMSYLKTAEIVSNNVHLTNGEIIPVSRSKRAVLINAFNK